MIDHLPNDRCAPTFRHRGRARLDRDRHTGAARRAPRPSCPSRAKGLDGDCTRASSCKRRRGTSISCSWATRSPRAGTKTRVWQRFYGPRHAANFGIGGDRTQHVLWRIQNGELDGIEPRVDRPHDRHQQPPRRYSRRDRPGNQDDRRRAPHALAQNPGSLAGRVSPEPASPMQRATGSRRSTKRSPGSTTGRTSVFSISARRS